MELLSRLQSAGNSVPVVILTAHGSIPEAVTAMKLGAIDFLTKPITPEALRRVVAEVIARHAASLVWATSIRGKVRSRRSLEASGLRSGEGQASHQSVPVRRGGDHSARDPRRRPRVDRGRSAAQPPAEAQGRGIPGLLPDSARLVSWWKQPENDEAVPMMSTASLSLGLAIFGLFFAMAAACDRL